MLIFLEDIEQSPADRNEKMQLSSWNPQTGNILSEPAEWSWCRVLSQCAALFVLGLLLRPRRWRCLNCTLFVHKCAWCMVVYWLALSRQCKRVVSLIPNGFCMAPLCLSELSLNSVKTGSSILSVIVRVGAHGCLFSLCSIVTNCGLPKSNSTFTTRLLEVSITLSAAKQWQ